MNPSAELIRLVDKSRAQTISSKETLRLEKLLKNEQNLEYYLDLASLDAGLTLLSEKSGVSPRNIVPFVQKYAARLIATAAIIMFVFGYLSGQIGMQPSQHIYDMSTELESENDGSFGLITSLVGVEWDGPPTDLLQDQESSPIRFKSGLVEVTFKSGVRALVEGPAEIQITGENQAYLERGRLVANVPKGAEGFTVDHQQGKLVDLGTEFAMNIQGLSPVEVGVFRGEVEVYTSAKATPVKIIENHAVLHGDSMGNEVKSVPFQRDQYIRTLPSSDFSWKFPDVQPSELVTKEFDVSHLVWKGGEYKAIVKWMDGRDGITIHKVELYYEGELVSSDIHSGAAGIPKFAYDNVYSLQIPNEVAKKGGWKLRVEMQLRVAPGELPAGFVADSAGVVLFEEVGKIQAEDRDFIGRWEYRHNGNIHQRVFHPDHTATYFLNGERHEDFDHSTWKVENNVLILKLPATGGERPEDIFERHLMRNRAELIFQSLPYRNGKKIASE